MLLLPCMGLRDFRYFTRVRGNVNQYHIRVNELEKRVKRLDYVNRERRIRKMQAEEKPADTLDRDRRLKLFPLNRLREGFHTRIFTSLKIYRRTY